MPETDKTERFVQQLTEHQNRLYGYVYSLVGDRNQAADVLQETNLVLWRKIAEFQPDKPFLPWAFAIARFQVLAHVRDKSRDRMLLDAELVESLSQEAERQSARLDDIRGALRPCLGALQPAHRELVECRYFHGLSLAETATRVERSVGSLKVALLRIRRQLATCVRTRLANEGGSL